MGAAPMIARDAVPIGHRPVYKPIDVSGRRLPKFISHEDVQNGACREPDPALYSETFHGWVRKE
jgi:hypothetical protein